MPTLLEHVFIHLEQEAERKFKCEECGRGYRHAGSLANHKKAHDVGTFRCSECGKENSNALALKNHMRSHTSQKKYSCLRCGKAFRLATQLATHERVHLTMQAKECKDMEYEKTDGEDMTEVFNSPCDTSDDAAGRPFKCDLCDKTYIHHRSLSNHKKTHQLGMFECTVCFKLFNNMAALYNHQRTHKVSSSSSVSGFPTNSTLQQFSPQSHGAPVNFCHLCQVLFPSDEEFQDHIQMHNSLSASFGLQNTPAESRIVAHDNTSDSNCCAPHLTNPSVSHDSLNGFVYSDCSNNQTPQGVPSLIDTNDVIPLLAQSAPESGSVRSDERPFRCQICGKSYRHSGSLINHKRSHQVGTYHCSICKKSYPHLAALKSHLRLHKGQKCSSSLNGDEDWLSLEPFTLNIQQGGFPSQEDDVCSRGFDQENGGYSEQLNQELPPDVSGQPPHSEHLMQRHMCADCGETFADITGIIAHSCSLLQQQHTTSDDCGTGVSFHEQNDANYQSYLEHGNLSRDRLNGDEEDDADLYQCSICGNSYTNIRALRSHLRGHTQSQSATTTSSGPSSLSSQEEPKDKESEEMMICSTCGESFACRQDLLTHQLVHIKHSEDEDTGKSDRPGSEEEAESIVCSSSGIFCANFHHLERHDSTATREEGASVKEEELKAKGAQQEDTSAVKDDIEASADRQYRCDQCGRSYRHAGSLLNHKKSHKTGVFKCHICHKRFYNLLALKNHQRSHFDVKRHTCHECGKAFKTQKQLLNHLRRHKENRAKIQELNDQIQALMQLNRTKLDEGTRDTRVQATPNARVKSEDAGVRPFACEQCGRTYRHAGSLVNHRKSHKTGHYYCSVCNNAYSNQLAMKNHLRTHFASRKHSCQKCGRAFRGKKLLSVHICAESQKGGKRSFRQRASKCKQCKQTFPSADQLAAHSCRRSPGSGDPQADCKEERTFTCSICQRSYRHAGSLLNHKNTHKTGHFACTVCSKSFSNPMALRNHTRIHTQKKKYACVTCGKAFRLASLLHNHQKVHSRVNGHFSCSACGKNFQGRSGLQRHRCRRGEGSGSIQRGENLDKCFTCDLCGRSYRHAGSLLNHKKTHSENLHHCALCLQTFPDLLTLQIHSQMRRHCCPECGKTFCLILHLQSHMEAHSRACQQHTVEGKPEGLGWDLEDSKEVPPPLSHLPGSDAAEKGKSHACEHCGRTYRHAGSLLNHKNSHKTGSFSCSVCYKEFTNLMALKNHRRIHTEPKRYQCLECGKAFRVSTQLICHRRIHSKERPFACLLCNKNFSSKSNLRHHEKMHRSQQSCDSASFSWDANTFMGLDVGSFL